MNTSKKYEVVAGSGCDSGAQGWQIPMCEVPTRDTGGGSIPAIDGHYKPVTRDDRAIRTDDGTIIIMHKDRLKLIGTKTLTVAELAASGQLKTDVVMPSDLLTVEIERLSIEYADQTYTNPSPSDYLAIKSAMSIGALAYGRIVG